VAHIAGAVGTLVVADLVNLGRPDWIGAGVASMGGPAHSPWSFLNGSVAVPLAAIA